MFYDNFTQEQICGLFTPTHVVVIALFLLLTILCLYLSRNMSQQKVKKTLLIIAIIMTILEVIKMAIRIYKHESPNAWIPLYYCSLFLFAIWFIFCKSEFLQNIGYAFMSTGGLFASVSFIIYPSTSLMTLPVWHPGSIHSIVYHFLMTYCCCLVLMHKLYVPKIKHFWNYLILLTTASVLGMIVNECLGTNMMFLADPYALPVLDKIVAYSKYLYALIAYLAQSVLLYFAMFGVVKLITNIINKKKEKNNGAI